MESRVPVPCLRQPIKPCSPRRTISGLLMSFNTNSSCSPAKDGYKHKTIKNNVGHMTHVESEKLSFCGITKHLAQTQCVVKMQMCCQYRQRHSPAVSTAAASCPFFLAARYFPLLAFSATFDPFHSRSKKQLGDLVKEAVY